MGARQASCSGGAPTASSRRRRLGVRVAFRWPAATSHANSWYSSAFVTIWNTAAEGGGAGPGTVHDQRTAIGSGGHAGAGSSDKKGTAVEQHRATTSEDVAAAAYTAKALT